MDFSAEFEEKFKRVQEDLGRTKTLPGPLLRAWEYLVQQCEQGYDDNIDELMHDFQNRKKIDDILNSASLKDEPEMAKFRECVAVLDRRFKNLQIRDPALPLMEVPWWQAYPLRIGGKELAEDYWSMYGIRIEVVP